MAKMRSYKSQMTVLAGISLTAAVLAGLLGSRIMTLRTGQTDFWLIYLPLLGLVVFAFAAMIPWWRKLDDLQKAGQLNAWYWGGQIGGFIVLTALVAATGQQSDLSRGALALLLGEAGGFAIAWLMWRWHSRGPAE